MLEGKNNSALEFIYFSLYFIKYSLYRKMLQMKNVGLGICIQ